ncbi:MAG: DUF1571 domain-containing protein [Syntrophobacteraceae bacterium]
MRSDNSDAGTAIRPRPCFFLPLIFCTALLVPSFLSASDPKDALISFLEQMELSYAKVNDYQAIFHKQERLEGKLLPEETILLKFQKPLKIYMHWIGELLKGQEALYVQGQYDDKLIAHRGGILGLVTMSLDPDGPTAMQGNRYPITKAGFGNTIEQLRYNVDRALRHGDLQIIRIGEEPFEGRPAAVIEAGFTSREGREYHAARMVIHLDGEFMLPVGSRYFDQKDILIEKYTYTDVKLNAGFTDMDFSRSNEEYHF